MHTSQTPMPIVTSCSHRFVNENRGAQRRAQRLIALQGFRLFINEMEELPVETKGLIFRALDIYLPQATQ